MSPPGAMLPTRAAHCTEGLFMSRLLQPPPSHHLASLGVIQAIGVFALSSTAHSTLPALRMQVAAIWIWLWWLLGVLQPDCKLACQAEYAPLCPWACTHGYRCYRCSVLTSMQSYAQALALPTGAHARLHNHAARLQRHCGGGLLVRVPPARITTRVGRHLHTACCLAPRCQSIPRRRPATVA